MSDRELLELAAKAVGYKLQHSIGARHPYADQFHVDGSPWNPLADDGDALRLAVRLNIEFACFDDHQSVNAGVWSPNGNSWDCMTPYNGDKIAATRRAIVRAAAEIGRAMP